MKQVYLLLNNTLQEMLVANNINPTTYSPAYAGESVGLDLYNIGPKLIIPPVEKLWTYATDGNYNKLRNPLTWLDFPEDIRKLIGCKLMPTGIKAVIPNGYGGFIWGRGSITKTPIIHRAGVIDPGYTGEIFVNVVNVSQVPFILEENTKSPFQLVIQKITTNFNIIKEEEFIKLSKAASRQTGMIGSSD